MNFPHDFFLLISSKSETKLLISSSEETKQQILVMKFGNKYS